jgi:hypothetical protein
MSGSSSHAVLADDEREAAIRFEEALSADLDHWPFWRGRLPVTHGRCSAARTNSL